MPLTVVCPTCRGRFLVGEKHAGKKGSCPKCGRRILIPQTDAEDVAVSAGESAAPAPSASQAATDGRMARSTRASREATAPTSANGDRNEHWAPAKLSERVTEHEALSVEELLAKMPDSLPRRSVGILYHLYVWVVFFLILLVPVLYFGVLLGIGWLWVLVLQNGIGWLVLPQLYLMLVLGLPLTMLFLLLPLANGFGAVGDFPESGREIGPEEEPTLHAFVAEIARLLQAPVPTRIVLDADINASAGFDGLSGFLSGRGLVLTIGLPLVADFSVQQLGGVIAHELGHFAQGRAMRLQAFIRRISFWLYMVIYRPPSEEHGGSAFGTERSIGYIGILIVIARAFVGALFAVTQTASGLLLRRMEYDADGREAAFAGSKQAVRTTRRLYELAQGIKRAGRVLLEKYQKDNKLPNDWGSVVRACDKEVTGAQREALYDRLDREMTWPFDTHPCYKDRVKAFRALKAKPAFKDSRPAAMLLRSYPALAEEITVELYRTYLGPVQRYILLPTSEAMPGYDVPPLGPERKATEQFEEPANPPTEEPLVIE